MSTEFYITVEYYRRYKERRNYSIFSAPLGHLQICHENLEDLPGIFRNTTKKNGITSTNIKNKCDALSDLVTFVQLIKCENHPQRSRVFRSKGDWEDPHLLPEKLACSSHLFPLFCSKNVDFVIFMQFLAILPCNFTKSITLPWVFFTLFKLYKMVPNRAKPPKYIKYPILTYSITISYFLHHVNLLKYKNN